MPTTQNRPDNRRPGRAQTPGLEQPDFNFAATHHALIIGAGLAGCAVANTLAARGMRCTVLDQHGAPAQATSAVPAAIYHPSSTASPQHDFLNECFNNLVKNLPQEAIVTRGLLLKAQHPGSKPAPSHWPAITESAASALSQTKLNGDWLHCGSAGALNPQTLCKHWLSNPLINFSGNASVASLHQINGKWTATDAQSRVLGSGDLVVLANAHAASEFVTDVPLIPVRGQLTCFNKRLSAPVICSNGYIVPVKQGVWAGATFQRHETSVALSTADSTSNHTVCSSHYTVSPEPLQEWAGIRCTTPDRFPVIGAIPSASQYKENFKDLHLGRTRQQFAPAEFIHGMYALVGLGSHGVLQALYGAGCLADIIFAEHTPTSRFYESIHPARFLMRQLRKSPLNR